MATEGTKLMEEIYDQFLVCKICFESYKNPKTLNCLHVFCCECLEKHNDSEMERSSYRYMIYVRALSCPICRKKTDIPTGGVRRLPDNFLVSSLTEIVDRRRPSHKFLCEICQHSPKKQATSKCVECAKLLCRRCVIAHRKTNVTQNHSLFDIEAEKDVLCKAHLDESVRFYCEPCEACICVLCTFQEHKGHDVSSFTDGMRKYGSILRELIGTCKKRITDVKTHIDVISKCEDAIKTAEGSIRDTTIDLISSIRANERKLMKEVQTAFGENTTEFIDSKQCLQETLDNLLSTCNLTDLIIKDNSLELLLLKKDIQTKLQLMLEADIPPLPEKVDRSIKFIPGSVTFGCLHNEVKYELNNDNDNDIHTDIKFVNNVKETVKANCSIEVQTDLAEVKDAETTMGKLVIDYETEAFCQSDVVPSKHETSLTTSAVMSSRGTTPCYLHNKEVSTMTVSGKPDAIAKKCQTENIYGIGKSTSTSPPDIAHIHTNTPVLELRSRAACTYPIERQDVSTETDDLVLCKSTSANTNRIQSQEQGMVTTENKTCSKQISVEIETADKLTDTPKPVVSNKGSMTGIDIIQNEATLESNLILAQKIESQSIETQVDYSQLHIMKNECSQTSPQISEEMPQKKFLVHRSVGTDRTGMKSRFTMTNIQINHSETNTDPVSIDDSTREKVVLVDKHMCTANDQTMECSTTTNHCVKTSDRAILTHKIPMVDSSTATSNPITRDRYTQIDKTDSKCMATTTPTIHTSDKIVHTEVARKDTATVTELDVKSTREASCVARPTTLTRETCTPHTQTCDAVSLTCQIDTTDFSVGDSSTVLIDAHTMTPQKHFKDTETTVDSPLMVNASTNTLLTEKLDKNTSAMVVPLLDVSTMAKSVNLKDSSTSVTKPNVNSRATCTATTDTKNATTNTVTDTRDICIGEFAHHLDDKSTGFDHVKVTDVNMCTDNVDVIDAATQVQKTSKSVGTFTPMKSQVEHSTNTPNVVYGDKQIMFCPQMMECSMNTETKELATRGTLTSNEDNVSRGISPASIPELFREAGVSVITSNKCAGTATDEIIQRDAACDPVPTSAIDSGTMTSVRNSDKSTLTLALITKSQSTTTAQRKMVESGTGTGCVLTLDKETGTPQIHQIHKNVSTDSMITADKQTNTSNVASAYRRLVAPHVVMKTKGTSTDRPITKDVQTLALTAFVPNGSESMHDEITTSLSRGSLTQEKCTVLKGEKSQYFLCDMCQLSLGSKNPAYNENFSVPQHVTENNQNDDIVKNTSSADSETKSRDIKSTQAEHTAEIRSDSDNKSDKKINELLDVSQIICTEYASKDRDTSPVKENNEKMSLPLTLSSHLPTVPQNKRVTNIKENTQVLNSMTTETAKSDLSLAEKCNADTSNDIVSTDDRSKYMERKPREGNRDECIPKPHGVTKRLQPPIVAAALSPSASPSLLPGPLPQMETLSLQEVAADNNSSNNEAIQLPRFSPYLSRRRLKSIDSDTPTTAYEANGSKRYLARKQKPDLNQLLSPEGDEHDKSVTAPKLHVKTVQRKVIPKLENMLPTEAVKGPQRREQQTNKESNSGSCHSPSPNEVTTVKEKESSITGCAEGAVCSVSKSTDNLPSHKVSLQDLTAQLRRRHDSTPQLGNIPQHKQGGVDISNAKPSAKPAKERHKKTDPKQCVCM